MGKTVLFFAATNEKEKAVKCLLNYSNIHIDRQSINGYTALMAAAKFNNCPIIKLLIDRGADINKVNFVGQTALITAADYGAADAVKCLLEYPGIHINQQNFRGSTALTMAIFDRNIPIIELLIDAGADPEIANDNGFTLLQIAQETNNQKIIDLIQNAINKKHGK